MVAFGTLFSSFWILAANSWMQTPAGYKIINGRFFPVDWFQIIFNPSFPYRLAHNVVGFYITTALVVIAVSAYFVRKNKFFKEGQIMLSMTFWLLTVLVPLQIILGDLHGLNTLKYQPAKLAAIEADWTPAARAPLILFAIPDVKAETNHDVVEVPLLGSIILTHHLNGVVPGLKQWPADQRAPVPIPFFSFRIMVALGLIMLTLVLMSLWLRIRHRLYDANWFLNACQFSAPLGFLAILAGWVTTESGRQPWTVYGLLRTVDSVTPSLTGTNVIFSLLGYMLVYLIIFPTGLALMLKIIKGGITTSDNIVSPIEGGQHRSPISTTPEQLL